MLKHTLAITVAVAAVSLATPGVGSAGTSACTPHCAPAQASHSADKVLNRANEAAGTHGQHGRDKAVAKQEAHRGSVALPLVTPPAGDTGGGTGGGTGGDTGGDTGGGNPCSGC